MGDTYEINDRDEVIPYTSGRRCSDTRAWRDATELEIQQRDEISRLESEVEKLEAKIAELQDYLANPDRTAPTDGAGGSEGGTND